MGHFIEIIKYFEPDGQAVLPDQQLTSLCDMPRLVAALTMLMRDSRHHNMAQAALTTLRRLGLAFQPAVQVHTIQMLAVRLRCFIKLASCRLHTDVVL